MYCVLWIDGPPESVALPTLVTFGMTTVPPCRGFTSTPHASDENDTKSNAARHCCKRSSKPSAKSIEVVCVFVFCRFVALCRACVGRFTSHPQNERLGLLPIDRQLRNDFCGTSSLWGWASSRYGRTQQLKTPEKHDATQNQCLPLCGQPRRTVVVGAICDDCNCGTTCHLKQLEPPTTWAIACEEEAQQAAQCASIFFAVLSFTILSVMLFLCCDGRLGCRG